MPLPNQSKTRESLRLSAATAAAAAAAAAAAGRGFQEDTTSSRSLLIRAAVIGCHVPFCTSVVLAFFCRVAIPRTCELAGVRTLGCSSLVRKKAQEKTSCVFHLHMAPEAVDGLAERATAQILHFSLLFSGAILQIAPAQSYFQSEIGRLLCNSQ